MSPKSEIDNEVKITTNVNSQNLFESSLVQIDASCFNENAESPQKFNTSTDSHDTQTQDFNLPATLSDQVKTFNNNIAKQ